MKVKLNVKDKSVQTFLESVLLGYKPSEGRNSGMHYDNAAYQLMRDEMFFKINCGIEVGEFLKIELFDRCSGSQKELINTYIYEAIEYDDISIKMKLTNFKVTTK